MAVKSNLINMVAVLGLTCLFCSGVLGGAYVLTKEPIDKAAAEKTNKAISQVLPSFTEVTYNEADHYYTATDGETLVGYAIESTVVGFGGPLSLIVGLTPDGVVYNTSVLSHAETPGLAPSAPPTPSSWTSGRASTRPLRSSPSRRTAATWTPSRLPPSPPAPTPWRWRMPLKYLKR